MELFNLLHLLKSSFIGWVLRHILALFGKSKGVSFNQAFYNDTLIEKDFIFDLLCHAKLISALNQKLSSDQLSSANLSWSLFISFLVHEFTSFVGAIFLPIVRLNFRDQWVDHCWSPFWFFVKEYLIDSVSIVISYSQISCAMISPWFTQFLCV